MEISGIINSEIATLIARQIIEEREEKIAEEREKNRGYENPQGAMGNYNSERDGGLRE